MPDLYAGIHSNIPCHSTLGINQPTYVPTFGFVSSGKHSVCGKLGRNEKKSAIKKKKKRACKRAGTPEILWQLTFPPSSTSPCNCTVGVEGDHGIQLVRLLGRTARLGTTQTLTSGWVSRWEVVYP